MKIDRKTIEWIANLSQLRLNKKEEEQMEAQLGKILDYMDILGELDLQDVSPTAHTLGFTNRTREDTKGECFAVKTVAELAPQWDRGHIVVPRIV